MVGEEGGVGCALAEGAVVLGLEELVCQMEGWHAQQREKLGGVQGPVSPCRELGHESRGGQAKSK